jgi:hypothetical protein
VEGSAAPFQHEGLFGGDHESFADFKANGMPLLVGGVFLAMGSVALLVGLLTGIVLLVTVL